MTEEPDSRPGDTPGDIPGDVTGDVTGDVSGDGPVDAPIDVPIDVSVEVDMVANARRRHGSLGAVMAAGMLGIDQVLGRKPREEAPIVVSSNSDPVDIDTDGIAVAVDEGVSVIAPALPRTPPAVAPARRRRR
jgi:hypothetical protein